MALQRVAFYTLGCKLNQYETEAIREAFEAADYLTVSFQEEADVYVVNTCTVTNRAAANSRKMLRRAARLNPDAVVVAAGCHSEVAAEELASMDAVDLVVGNVSKTRIPDLLAQGQRGMLASEQEPIAFEAFDIGSFARHSRAFIKIQEGCNCFCTYCIIPYARNRLGSRSPESIIKQVNKLVNHGYQEVVVAGTHLGLFGVDRGENTRLVDILKRLCSETSLERIRLSSLEPMDITEELLDFIKEEPRICRHLHLPLQSGSDSVLGNMGRPYTTADIKDLFARLTQEMPDVCLGTDVIAGFPGESEEQYRQTYAFLSALPLAYMHVFPFSRRPGTPAAEYSGQVHPDKIKQRSRELNDLRNAKLQSFKTRFINRTVYPLVESRRDKKTECLVGITDNYLRILFKGQESLFNRIVPVVPLKLDSNGNLYGEMQHQ